MKEHWSQCKFYDDNECTCEKLVEEFSRRTFPDLYEMEPRELRDTMYRRLYAAEVALRAMVHRGTFMEGWWKPETVLEVIEPLTEEHGWEGIGR
jgi:hypothetical protein